MISNPSATSLLLPTDHVLHTTGCFQRNSVTFFPTATASFSSPSPERLTANKWHPANSTYIRFNNTPLKLLVRVRKFATPPPLFVKKRPSLFRAFGLLARNVRNEIGVKNYESKCSEGLGARDASLRLILVFLKFFFLNSQFFALQSCRVSGKKLYICELQHFCF